MSPQAEGSQTEHMEGQRRGPDNTSHSHMIQVTLIVPEENLCVCECVCSAVFDSL